MRFSWFRDSVLAGDPIDGLISNIRSGEHSLKGALGRLREAEPKIDLRLLKMTDLCAEICIMNAQHDRLQPEGENDPVLVLTIDQLAAIKIYTMSNEPQDTCLYFNINAALRMRQRRLVWPYAPLIRLISEALAALPPVGQITVYRGVQQNLTRDYHMDMPRIAWPSFTSTTTNEKVSDDYLGTKGPRTKFVIRLREHTGARDISKISRFQEEDEILLPPNTCFELVSVHKPRPQDADQLMIVHLREVEFDAQAETTFGNIRGGNTDAGAVVPTAPSTYTSFDLFKKYRTVDKLHSHRGIDVYDGVDLEKGDTPQGRVTIQMESSLSQSSTQYHRLRTEAEVLNFAKTQGLIPRTFFMLTNPFVYILFYQMLH